jgi:hypothetical protein
MRPKAGLISFRVEAVDFPCICQKRPQRTLEKPFRRLWTIRDEEEGVLLICEPSRIDNHITVGPRITSKSGSLLLDVARTWPRK